MKVGAARRQLRFSARIQLLLIYDQGPARLHGFRFRGRFLMKALAEFTRTTLVGGILVLLKALSAVMALMAPVTARVPATAELRQVIAILITLAACFIAGIVVRTGPGGRGIQKLQRHVLEKIPGYKLLRNIMA